MKVIQLQNDGLTRPTSNTSPTICSIFTLKSCNSDNGFQSINLFCYFINSDVAKFMTKWLSWRQPSLVMGTSIFIKTTSKHWKNFRGPFKWICPRTITIMSHLHKRKVREALEISKLKTCREKDKTFKVLNRDKISQKIWKHVFCKWKTIKLKLEFGF